MQLDCKRHAVSGVRADTRCYKCAKREEKKISVDSPSRVTASLVASSQPRLSRSVDQPKHEASPAVTNAPSIKSPAAAALVLAEGTTEVLVATQLHVLRRGPVTQGEVFLRSLGTEGIEQFARALREGIRRAKGKR